MLSAPLVLSLFDLQNDTSHNRGTFTVLDLPLTTPSSGLVVKCFRFPLQHVRFKTLCRSTFMVKEGNYRIPCILIHIFKCHTLFLIKLQK